MAHFTHSYGCFQAPVRFHTDTFLVFRWAYSFYLVLCGCIATVLELGTIYATKLTLYVQTGRLRLFT